MGGAVYAHFHPLIFFRSRLRLDGESFFYFTVHPDTANIFLFVGTILAQATNKCCATMNGMTRDNKIFIVLIECDQWATIIASIEKGNVNDAKWWLERFDHTEPQISAVYGGEKEMVLTYMEAKQDYLNGFSMDEMLK